MASCKECLHIDVCEKRNRYHADVDEFTGRVFTDMDKSCEYFKDRSKFIELPCAIGSNIWAIQPTRKIIEYTVNGIHQYEDKHFMFGAYRIRDDGKKINPTWSDYEIGKTVFLTREEAEQALKNQN